MQGRRVGVCPRTALIVATMLAISGCASVGYLWQAGVGQWRLASKGEPIATLIDDPQTPAALRERLILVRSIRRYAADHFDLDAGDSYRRYVDLNRRFVVWNVFAAPALAMKPVQWCFPVAGCVGYRGYFHHDAAQRFAARLAAKGYDTWVGGVPAYSTLGWFDDPVLSTFVWQDDAHLAGLLFHELAHRRLYLKGDTPFNESFATAVADAGVCSWLSARGRGRELAAYRVSARARERFLQWLAGHRRALAAIYRAPLSAAEKRARKAAYLRAMQREFANLISSDPALAAYREWVMHDLNNAKLLSARAYHRWVDGFRQLLVEHAGDWPGFFDAVRRLADLPADQRDTRLGSLGQQWRRRGRRDDSCPMAAGVH